MRQRIQRHIAQRGASPQPRAGYPSEDGDKESSGTESADACLLRVGPELWSAVVREGPTPAEDTRAALQAIRAALEAVRRLRFAGVAGDERCRLAALAAEAVERQERALWLWSLERGAGMARAEGSAACKDGNEGADTGIGGGRFRRFADGLLRPSRCR